MMPAADRQVKAEAPRKAERSHKPAGRMIKISF